MPGVQSHSEFFQCSEDTNRQTGKQISVIQCNTPCVAE